MSREVFKVSGTAGGLHDGEYVKVGHWAMRFRRFLRPEPLVVNREDLMAVVPSDSPALQKSKKRVKFLLAMMDELTDRKLSPEKAIDVAMIWLKTPAALEDLEQWGGKKEE